VSGQVKAGFLAARFDRGKRREQPCPDARVRRATIGLFREHPEGVHVPAELEGPSVGHLHRQALRAGRRGDAQRQAQQQQRETLHTRFPPWEFTWPILPLVPSRRQLQLGSARYSDWQRGPPTSKYSSGSSPTVVRT